MDFVIKNGVLVEYRGNGGNVVIPNGVTTIGREAFDYSLASSIIIPEGVRRIESLAFWHCYELVSISIPKSVTSIEIGLNAQCPKLIHLTVEKGNPKYHSAGNCVIETKSRMLISACNSSVVPLDGSVEYLGESAFQEIPNLTSVKLPYGLKVISEYAFCGCDSLLSVFIPESVYAIEDGAFMSCEKLCALTIPPSVTEIGNEAFSYCNNLTIYAYGWSYAASYARDKGIHLISAPSNQVIGNFSSVEENSQRETIKKIEEDHFLILKQYKELLDIGIISLEEFNTVKKKLLGDLSPISSN